MFSMIKVKIKIILPGIRIDFGCRLVKIVWKTGICTFTEDFVEKLPNHNNSHIAVDLYQLNGIAILLFNRESYFSDILVFIDKSARALSDVGLPLFRFATHFRCCC